MLKSFVAITLLIAATASAEDAFDKLTDGAEMNGIRFSDYKNFFEWPLVTVRFRRDTEEQRFTYANKVAWDALAANSKDYPDQSVFVKVGYITENDPAFASSAVPSGGRRIQVMVRDKKKYKSTDGWGYALFKLDGTTLVGDNSQTAMQCAACHRIVPERGYVFSQPFDRRVVVAKAPAAPGGASYDKTLSAAVKTAPKNIFVERPISAIPLRHLVRTLIPATAKDINLVEGDMLKSVFIGSYVEIIPSLVNQALKTNKPAALIEENSKGKFSLAFVMDDKAMECPKQERPVFVAMSVSPYYLPRASQRNSSLEVRQICVKTPPR